MKDISKRERKKVSLIKISNQYETNRLLEQ